jgi:hypothetical protein
VLPGERRCSEPVRGEDVNPCQHAARLVLIDSHGSDAPALSAPACLGIAHRSCDALELAGSNSSIGEVVEDGSSVELRSFEVLVSGLVPKAERYREPPSTLHCRVHRKRYN